MRDDTERAATLIDHEILIREELGERQVLAAYLVELPGYAVHLRGPHEADHLEGRGLLPTGPGPGR